MSPPKVLIVYANPAHFPPVPPYGAERVVQVLSAAGCAVRLVAPFLGFQPLRDLKRALTWRPDVVGFSIRQIDDGLVVRAATGDKDIDTRFYLPQIRPLVQAAQAQGCFTLLGGPGVSAMPQAVCHYLGAAAAMAGPADDLLAQLGRALVAGTPPAQALPSDPRVVRGAATSGSQLRAVRERGDSAGFQLASGTTPRMWEYLTLARVRGLGVPVQLAAGCNRRCHYCVEASFVGRAVKPRAVSEIVAEISFLRSQGIARIHLSASEINVPDAQHAIAVLQAIKAARLGVQIEGFINPAPLPSELLDALEQVGVDPAGLCFELGHLDDELLRQGAGPANRVHIDRLVELYLRRGYRALWGSLLLGSHPREEQRHIDHALSAVRQIDQALPAGFNLSYATGARVYAEAPLGRWVAENLDAARPHLYGQLSPGFIAPLVFARPAAPRLLFAQVQAQLKGCRGQMSALNAEVPTDPGFLPAEKHVNLAILHLERGQLRPAQARLRQALRRFPNHGLALQMMSRALFRAWHGRAAARRAAPKVEGAKERRPRPGLRIALSQLEQREIEQAAAAQGMTAPDFVRFVLQAHLRGSGK